MNVTDVIQIYYLQSKLKLVNYLNFSEH